MDWMTYQEVAERLGMAVGSVRTLMLGCYRETVRSKAELRGVSMVKVFHREDVERVAAERKGVAP